MLGECPYTDLQISSTNYIQWIIKKKEEGEEGEGKEKEKEEEKVTKGLKESRLKIYWTRNFVY